MILRNLSKPLVVKGCGCWLKLDGSADGDLLSLA